MSYIIIALFTLLAFGSYFKAEAHVRDENAAGVIWSSLWFLISVAGIVTQILDK